MSDNPRWIVRLPGSPLPWVAEITAEYPDVVRLRIPVKHPSQYPGDRYQRSDVIFERRVGEEKCEPRRDLTADREDADA